MNKQPEINNGAWLKMARRWYVEQHHAKALESPFLCGLALKAKGWFKPGTGPLQCESHVKRILEKIRAQGFKYLRLTERMLERKYREMTNPAIAQVTVRAKRDYEYKGSYPRIFEKKVFAKRCGERWSKKDLDSVFSRLLNGESRDKVNHDFGRDAWHQFRSMYLNDDGVCLFEYQPTSYREWRGGRPLTGLDIRIIKIHQGRGYNVALTAKFLQRPPEECQLDWKPCLAVTAT